MPARTRQSRASAAEVVEQEEEQQRGGLKKLRFNEPLSWRPGKSAIPVANLLDRLQSLAQELSRMEQDEVDKSSLRKISQELASGQLLGHRVNGVRAWAACCIVDILRLCAPDAPFTSNQLKDIFTCIVTSIIPALGNPSDAFNTQHFYVLNSLADVKSIVLLTDLDAPDALIASLFQWCFDIVSLSAKTSTGEPIARNVEYDMTRLLVTVIDESPTLAPDLVDIIVAQFLRVDPRVFEQPSKKGKKETTVDPKQDTLLLKEYPAAYEMAKALCHACPEKMISHISQYFNNVIIDASAPSMESSKQRGLDESDDDAEDIKELGKAHRLIRELWRACPDVLQNVIPQLEAELSADSVSLRLLATETIGDLVAGIGVQGPPPPPPMDPAAYPPVTLSEYPQKVPQPNALQAPLAPKPFAQVHSSAYESFLTRRQDKSPVVRSAWVTAIGRILVTSAGGSGLSEADEQNLVKSLGIMLRDADEKVRVAAVDAIGSMGFTDIVHKLGVTGGLSSSESVLSILAERVKDRKPQVREHAMKVFARIWAVAAGEIEENNDVVVGLLKDAPSRIYDAYYTNDPEIQALIDRVQFEYLLPLNYPPIKSKISKTASSQSQRPRASLEGNKDEGAADRIRVQRILTLLKGLDDKAKKVFFAFQARQLNLRDVFTIFLQTCEDYNGGVMEKDEDRIKSQLTRVIDTLSKSLPDSSRVSADLWKFAKAHDRRNYQLIRFAMAAASDYRTVTKAIKELARRIQSSSTPSLLDTLTPFLYRASSLVFNRSHIPAIMDFSRTDEKGLANAAHEMLKEVSSRNPEVLEAQVQEMCKDLEAQAPAPDSSEEDNAEEILKACSGFAKKLPEKLPKERRFLQALTNYALYSFSPRAAKHAVSIIMAVADKKDMYARDLIQKCIKEWEYGSDHFLTRLATIAQLCLLAPNAADGESNGIVSIAVDQVLLKNRSMAEEESGYKWSEAVDDETLAKEWALKIIVNRLRGKEGIEDDEFRDMANPVYETLNKLIAGEGEISKDKDTPATQKPRLRLYAARMLIKLCASRPTCEQLLSPRAFNQLALVAQDRLQAVRTGFIAALRKKLSQKSHLTVRWYAIPCLLAFEPSVSLRESTMTWLRSRATLVSRQMQVNGKSKEQQTVMESMFVRLLSLLAYHPDYPPESEDVQNRIAELADFARYILFYLSAVANENNMSLIFHVAQRVKQARDGIARTEEMTTRLHTLSDLAQATIRLFADAYTQQHRIGGPNGGANILQTYPGKMRLPSSLFAAMTSHEEAQEAADKNYLPGDIDDTLEGVVRSWMRPKKTSHHAAQPSKKRKSEQQGDVNGSGTATTAKKARKNESSQPRPPRRRSSGTTKPKKKLRDEDGWASDAGDEAISTTERRRSGRSAGKAINYADQDTEEDDDLEMESAEEDEENEDDGEEEDDAAESENEDENENENENEIERNSESGSDEKVNGDGEAHDSDGETTGKKATGSRTKQQPSKSRTLPVRRSTRRR